MGATTQEISPGHGGNEAGINATPPLDYSEL
jgi:hypothetical protein